MIIISEPIIPKFNSSNDHVNTNRVIPFVEKAITNFKHPDKDDFAHAKIRNWMLWKILQRKCFRRDSFICRKCKINFKDDIKELTVNHIIPVAEDKTKWFDLENMETMCRKCHKILNDEEIQKRISVNEV